MNDELLPNDDLSALHEEHDDELWIVSYADMITLLFGFFVILYSFSTLDEKKFSNIASEVAGAFKSQNPRKDEVIEDNDVDKKLKAFDILVTMLNLAENSQEAALKIEKIMENRRADDAIRDLLENGLKIDKKNLELLRGIDRPVDILTEIIFPSLSLFEAGSTYLNPGADEKLSALARDLRVISNIAEIEVVGHTDSAPPPANASYNDNFTLSSLRAGVVAQKLIHFGLSPELISVRGMGGLRPIVPEKNSKGEWIRENKAKNRRIHIVIRRRGAQDGR